jgi:putative DNA methylase
VADGLAKAKNTSLPALERGGVLRSRAQAVQLLASKDLPDTCAVEAGTRISVWEVVMHLAKRLDEVGVPSAASLMEGASRPVDLHAAKELAYLLYQISHDKGWNQVAALFNGLATSWNDLARGPLHAPRDELPMRIEPT